MNLRTNLLKLGFALLVIAPVLRADAPAQAALLEERDRVLSQIVEEIESRHAMGSADDETVWSAKLALLSFRRDSAPTSAEKLAQQERIVALHEKKLGALETRSQAGAAEKLEVLRATDALLAAKQLQAEIQAEGKANVSSASPN